MKQQHPSRQQAQLLGWGAGSNERVPEAQSCQCYLLPGDKVLFGRQASGTAQAGEAFQEPRPIAGREKEEGAILLQPGVSAPFPNPTPIYR